MTTRRKILSVLASVPLAGKLFGKTTLPQEYDVFKSFDAQDWAKAFVGYIKQNPTIATDEKTMVAWFAGALMRGYYEHATLISKSITRAKFLREQAEKQQYIKYPCGCSATGGPDPLPPYCPNHSEEEVFLYEVRGAVGRGWCADANRNKEMDVHLAESIAQEIMKLSLRRT